MKNVLLGIAALMVAGISIAGGACSSMNQTKEVETYHTDQTQTMPERDDSDEKKDAGDDEKKEEKAERDYTDEEIQGFAKKIAAARKAKIEALVDKAKPRTLRIEAGAQTFNFTQMHLSTDESRYLMALAYKKLKESGESLFEERRASLKKDLKKPKGRRMKARSTSWDFNDKSPKNKTLPHTDTQTRVTDLD